ncbi:PPC domain [Dillenia turbinata]|uniref:AT-hook motif nuclear-localized protein n=1 Tax=Dillenia turbinata TaxID=194707 RepID=A0AAN8V2J1_9MAGN
MTSKFTQDLSHMLESVSLKESRVLRVNSAQGRLSLVNLAGPSSTCPISYQGGWEILSLTGMIVPGNKVGNHPIGGVSIGFIGQTGETIVGRIGGRVIADTAVMVSMTAYDLNGVPNAKRRRRAGPRSARPVPSTGKVLALPHVHEARTGGMGEQVIAGPSNAGHGVGSDQEGMPSAAGPSD